jgi:hypothetical protein
VGSLSGMMISRRPKSRESSEIAPGPSRAMESAMMMVWANGAPAGWQGAVEGAKARLRLQAMTRVLASGVRRPAMRRIPARTPSRVKVQPCHPELRLSERQSTDW